MSVFKSPTFYLFTTCVLSAIAFSTVSSFAVSYTAGSIPGAALLGWLITLCASALALVIVSSWLIHHNRSKEPSIQQTSYNKPAKAKKHKGFHVYNNSNSEEQESLLSQNRNDSKNNIDSELTKGLRGLETGRRRLVIGLAAITITVSLYLLASGLTSLLLDPTQFGTALKCLTNTSVTTITSIVFTLVLIYAIGSIMQDLFITPVNLTKIMQEEQQNSADNTNSFNSTGYRLGSRKLETSTKETSKQVVEEKKRLEAEKVQRRRAAQHEAALKRQRDNKPPSTGPKVEGDKGPKL